MHLAHIHAFDPHKNPERQILLMPFGAENKLGKLRAFLQNTQELWNRVGVPGWCCQPPRPAPSRIRLRRRCNEEAEGGDAGGDEIKAEGK